MTLYVMCGLSRAGKTTFAQKLAEKTGAVLVNLDTEMYGHRFESMPKVEREVWQKVRQQLADGKDVIYDSMALCRGERELILRNCCPPGCRTVCVFVDTPREVIEERGGVIPFDALKPPRPDEGFNELWTIREKTIWRYIADGNSNP